MRRTEHRPHKSQEACRFFVLASLPLAQGLRASHDLVGKDFLLDFPQHLPDFRILLVTLVELS